MSKQIMVLSELTLDTIINKMTAIIGNGGRFNNYEFSDGKVKVHHMINHPLSVDYRTNKERLRMMILFSFSGSSAMIFCVGDEFVFQDGKVIVTVKHGADLVPVDKNEYKTYVFEKVIPSKHTIWRDKNNKEISDNYFESVRQEMEDDFDNMWDF